MNENKFKDLEPIQIFTGGYSILINSCANPRCMYGNCSSVRKNTILSRSTGKTMVDVVCRENGLVITTIENKMLANYNFKVPVWCPKK